MHVGKTYPRTTKNFISMPDTGVHLGPARKMKLQTQGSFGIGSIAVMWDGLTVLSDVAEYDPSDETVLFYKFTHPTDSSVWIDFFCKLIVPTPIPMAPPVMTYEIKYESRYAGTLLGRRVRECSPEFLWTAPHTDSQVGPGWDDDPHPLQWFQQTFRCGAATWADQPEYHPYRH